MVCAETTAGRRTRNRNVEAKQCLRGLNCHGVREPCDTAGEILPVPPLLKEGTQKPPFVKGAARSAGGFGHVAVMKRTFASRIFSCETRPYSQRSTTTFFSV